MFCGSPILDRFNKIIEDYKYLTVSFLKEGYFDNTKAEIQKEKIHDAFLFDKSKLDLPPIDEDTDWASHDYILSSQIDEIVTPMFRYDPNNSLHFYTNSDGDDDLTVLGSNVLKLIKKSDYNLEYQNNDVKLLTDNDPFDF